MNHWGTVALVGVLLAGCGGGENGKGTPGGGGKITPPATDAVQPWDADAAPTIRIDLSFEGGPTTLVAARALTTPPPIPALGGSYLATVWAGGAIVDAVPIAPADVVRDAAGNNKGELVEVTSPASASRATVFVKDASGLEHIDILDASGAVALTIQPDQVQRVVANDLTAFEASYPWIHVVTPTEDPAQLLPSDLTDQISSVADPSGEIFDLLSDAFAVMTEGAQRSVATIAVVHMPDYGRHDVGANCTATFGRAFGSAFIINADGTSSQVVQDCQGGGFAQPMISTAVLHETAHNFTFLVGAYTQGGLAAWPAEAQQIAGDVVAHYRLQSGLDGLFTDIQQTAVDAGIAQNYAGPDAMASGLGPADGFATAYGATDALEDIAEVTGWVQLPRQNTAAICSFLQSSDTVDETNALAYTKTLTLKEVGLISAAQFQACVGGLHITSTPGIHLGTQLDLAGNLKSGQLDQDGAHFFGVVAQGPNTYEGLVRVLAPTNQPIGLHRLDDLGLTEVLANAPNNGFFLSNDHYELARTSASGLVLVAEASGTTSRGVILFMTFQSGLGNITDRFPISTWYAP